MRVLVLSMGSMRGFRRIGSRRELTPHLTTVDHSYGSLTAGTAALSTKTGVVDDMVLYGSPGAGPPMCTSTTFQKDTSTPPPTMMTL